MKQLQADDSARSRLAAHSSRDRDRIRARAPEAAPDSRGPITPLVVGRNHDAIEIAERLRVRDILIYPVRLPTVPDGTVRLRITLPARMTDEAIEHLIYCLTECC